MTTVAYRNGVIAVDSQATAGNITCGETNKIRKFKGCVCVGSGDLQDLTAFFDWVKKGMDIEKKPTINCLNGYIFKKNKIYYVDDKLVPYEVNAKYHAAGSGAQIAYGAMHMGASAKEAVKAACCLDVYTGGKVKTIKVK